MLIISNLSFLKKANTFSFISIPIVIGIIFSPEHGIIPMLPSTQNSLSWAIRVAITWITFVAGTRLLVALPNLDHIKRLAPIFLGYIVFVITTFLMLYYFFLSDQLFIDDQHAILKILIISLMLSSLTFSSKENPFLLPIFFFCLLYIFKDTIYKFTVLNLIIPLFIGVLMAVVCRLIISPKEPFNVTARLTLLGLCTLGTGLALGTHDLEVIVGLAFGWVMAFIHKFGVCSDPKLNRTVIPIKFVIAMFCGLYIHLSFSVIVIGALLALIRLTLKALILYTVSNNVSTTKENLLSNIPISNLALPIILSLQISIYNNDDTKFILSSFCIAFIVNDIIAFILEVFKKPEPHLHESPKAVS